MKIISTLLLLLVFLTSCKDSEIRLDHPFAKQVPVAYGTSLEECKKVFPNLYEAQPNKHYPDYTFEFLTYAIEIEPKNSFIGEDGFHLVGMYHLGFENNKLVKIVYHGASDEQYSKGAQREKTFKLISAASCERFVDCNNFNFPNSRISNKWNELSTNKYDITLRLDTPGKGQFLYEVKLKNS